MSDVWGQGKKGGQGPLKTKTAESGPPAVGGDFKTQPQKDSKVRRTGPTND